MLSPSTQSDKLLQSFESLIIRNDAPVTVAISGGSDSTALLLGLQAFYTQNEIRGDIVAVTVDHGLRPESAYEAQQVAELCADLRIDHVIKKWTRSDQSGGIQAAARHARYALISDAARSIDAQFVLTGHSLDDQLETIAMRSARGEGRGLAGISPATLYDRRTWFVRPLLQCSRQQLRDYLSERGTGWLEDPSNENTDFERVRMRQRAFTASEQHQLLGVQLAAQRNRSLEAAAGAYLLSDPAKFDFNSENNEGRLSLAAIGETGFEPALQTTMSKIAGRSHFASADIFAQVLDFAMQARKGAKFTAHGCLLAIEAGWLVVNLEKRANPLEKYCFDQLLPSTDLALASALNLRLKQPELPQLPIKTAMR